MRASFRIECGGALFRWPPQLKPAISKVMRRRKPERTVPRPFDETTPPEKAQYQKTDTAHHADSNAKSDEKCASAAIAMRQTPMKISIW